MAVDGGFAEPPGKGGENACPTLDTSVKFPL
jgi:hypothetical protein